MLSALPYLETPLQEISDTLLEDAGVRLIIKREDLNHPLVSGNKWWKLKYNLAEAKQTHFETLLTLEVRIQTIFTLQQPLRMNLALKVSA